MTNGKVISDLVYSMRGALVILGILYVIAVIYDPIINIGVVTSFIYMDLYRI